MTDRIGQQLGLYRLIRFIGKGGFAEVYLGEHVRMLTQAVVKPNGRGAGHAMTIALLHRLVGEYVVAQALRRADMFRSAQGASPKAQLRGRQPAAVSRPRRAVRRGTRRAQ